MIAFQIITPDHCAANGHDQEDANLDLQGHSGMEVNHATEASFRFSTAAHKQQYETALREVS